MDFVREFFRTLAFGLTAIGLLTSGALLGLAVLMSYNAYAYRDVASFLLAGSFAVCVWLANANQEAVRGWVLLCSSILQAFIGGGFLMTPGMEWPGLFVFGPLSLVFSFLHFASWRSRRARVQ